MTIDRRKNFIINIIYIVLIIGIVYIFIKHILVLVMPFIIGFLVALVLKPVINFVSTKFHVPHKIASVALVLLSYVGISSLVSWVGVRFVILIKNSIVRLPETYAIQIEPAIRDIFENVENVSAKLDPMMVQVIQDIAASISQSTGSVITKISSTVIDFISSSVSFLPGLFLGIIFAVISSLFFAIDYNKITAYLSNLLPSKNPGLFTEIKGMATGIGFKYVKAYAILMAVTFAELAIGLLLLRVDGAIEVAALIAVIDFLPVLGTGGVVIPWIFIELIQGNFPLAFGLTALYLLITVVRNILEPKLIGEQIGLHPLIMLICMYVGMKIFGFVGLIALPVTIVVIKYLYDNDKIHIFKQEESL
ncbi:sporulation integral membrane protein YtvI [Lacrimispora sp.]|uniref:sporulation integral membrane protein YtvI n=1 Tax=Lacrimispora sp. TaxID=2719234 RepID=UPI0029E2C85E|nr:hypothetical protein [Lacrimispora sp.]